MLGLPPDEVLVLFVGRPVPKKGIDLLLEAAGDDVSVVVAGGELAAPRPGGRVITLGAVSQDLLADVYRACDIFVLPSEAEAFPLTVQEAMASGLPVITTDDPGYDMYQLDRELVRLVPRRVLELRAAILELVADPHLRARMGRSFARDGRLAASTGPCTAARCSPCTDPRSSTGDRRRGGASPSGAGESGVRRRPARAVSETHSE